MPNIPDILRLRVLLCFLREDEDTCTMMEIARTLGEERYAVKVWHYDYYDASRHQPVYVLQR